MFVMTAALWDDLSRINNLFQDFDERTGEVSWDERLPEVLDILAEHPENVTQVEHTGSDGITRNRIRLDCIYEGEPHVVVMGRGLMWVE